MLYYNIATKCRIPICYMIILQLNVEYQFQFYLILEALSDAGVRHGLSRDVAIRHASQAMLVSVHCKIIVNAI